MGTRRAILLWAAPIALLGACASPRPADAPPAGSPPPPAAVVQPAAKVAPKPDDLPSDPVKLAERAAAAWEAREQPGKSAEASRAYEALATRVEAPAQPLIQAARARRFTADTLAARALSASKDAPTATPPGDLLAESAREAQACAADARKAWSALSPKAALLLDKGPPEAAFAELPAAAAEPLLLDALCTASWARARSFVALAERKDELKAAFNRVAVLDPTLDDAAADRQLGALLAQLPAYAGGDLQEARQHFDRALELAPNSPATRVLYARTVAVKQQDRALFEKLLAEAQQLPSRTIEDRAAQAEAKELSARADSLFGN